MSDKPEQPKFLNFDYLKSSQFRTVHADGAYIGLTQTGLTLTFFAERGPIPNRVVHEVNADGTIGNELVDKRDIRDSVIRDTEVSIIMNREVAQRVVDAIEDVLRRYHEEMKKVGGK